MTDTRIRVWDPLVRLFHWSLVVTFTVAYFTGEDDSPVHIWSGYAVIGLVVFRILWGFIGSRHARFSDFLTSPARVFDYLKSLAARRPERYLGHNPAGGWMIILLLIAVLLTSISGIKVYGLEGHGPLAAGGGEMVLISTTQADEDEHEEHDEDGHEGHEDEAEEFWEEIHEFLSNFTVLLIVLHIAGVLFSSVLHRENLVRAMITGDKQGARE